MEKPVNQLTNAVAVPKLIDLQRVRRVALNSRIRIENRLTSTVANIMGYYVGVEKDECKKKYVECQTLISKWRKTPDEVKIPEMALQIIAATDGAIQGYEALIDNCEGQMVDLIKQLPICEWLDEKDQSGFGYKSCAIIIGEAGDLNNYAGPAKLWKRMGLMPFEKENVTRMPSAWKSVKGLSAEDWIAIGYCPRRRSDLWNIEEVLMKLNYSRPTEKRPTAKVWTGPYRAKYDWAKADAAVRHPEWGVCSKCKGSGKTEKKGSACGNCKGTGQVSMHYHNHAHLLMGKLLLVRLWCAWTGNKPHSKEKLTPITALNAKAALDLLDEEIKHIKF